MKPNKIQLKVYDHDLALFYAWLDRIKEVIKITGHRINIEAIQLELEDFKWLIVDNGLTEERIIFMAHCRIIQLFLDLTTYLKEYIDNL